MSRRRRSKKERRTVLILATAFLVVAGAVAWVAVRGDDGPLLPPEDPAVLALRASPENAFNLLQEAVKRLPPKRKDRMYPVEGKPGKMAFYETEQGSIARLLDMWAPDDSKAVSNNLGAMEPAFEQVREALDAPFYLVPLSEEDYWSGPYDNPRHLRALGELLTARALHMSRIQGDSTGAWEYLLLAARLGSRIQEDGAGDSLQYGQWMLHDAVSRAPELARGCESAERLREAVRVLAEASAPSRNLARSLEETMRRLDVWKEQVKQERVSHRGFIRSVRNRMALQRQLGFLQKHEATLKEAVVLPYHEYRQWLEEHPSLAEHISTDLDYFIGNHIMWEIDHLLRENARSDAEVGAVALRLALMLYQREKGALPESLEALVPAYLHTMPVDPFSGGPFLYRRVDSDYILYSVGKNGVDNGGSDRKREDILYHEPPKEKVHR